MEKAEKIWCVIAKSRVKNSQMEFDNPIILCAYKSFYQAYRKVKRLEAEDEFLEWRYTIELTPLLKEVD